MRTSSDDGASFDGGRVIYATVESKANAGAPQVAFASGAVWVSFMCDEDTPPSARAWPSDAATKVMSAKFTTSKPLDFSGGAHRQTVAPGPSAMWPGLVVLKDEAFALYGKGGSAFLAGPLNSAQSGPVLAHA